jgi:hypothetical protein
MANLHAGGLQSMGEYTGQVGADSARIHEAWNRTDTLKLSQLNVVQKVVHVAEDSSDKTHLMDLNIRNVQANTGKHLIDVILEWEGALDIKDIVTKLQENQYGYLPIPFNQKSIVEVGFTMSVNICKLNENKHRIIKWFIFDAAQNLTTVTEQLVYGSAMQPHWTGAAYVMGCRKTLLYLFERLVGTTVLYMKFIGDSGSNAIDGASCSTYDREKRREGFRFIKEKGPKSNGQNQFVEWTDEWTNTAGSKIFGWSKGEVKESLTNYAKGSSGARTIVRWTLTLRKIHPRFFDALAIPMLRTHDTYGTMWIGRSRAGKSNASKTAGFAISGHQIELTHSYDFAIPSVITFKKLDFLRLEPGSKLKPAIGDDIAIHKLETDEVKATGDPKEEDALLWARWGGVQFEQNQSRQLCFNPYDTEYEKLMKIIKNGTQEEISLKDFIRLIDMNWPKDSTQVDVDAYLNRFNIYLLTDMGIYYKYAGDSKANIPKMCWPVPDKPDLFIPEATDIMKKYKKDQWFKVVTYVEDFKWDLALMRALASDRIIPPSITIQGPRLFSDDRNITHYRFASLAQLTALAPASAAQTRLPNICGSAIATHTPLVPCGTVEDQQELQTILRRKTMESGLDGSTLDLITPPSSPARHTFCGTQQDADQLQNIFHNSVKAIANQEFVISDDEEIPSPPRKRQFMNNDADAFDEDAIQKATLNSLLNDPMVHTQEPRQEVNLRFTAGSASSSTEPRSHSPFNFGTSFDDP